MHIRGKDYNCSMTLIMDIIGGKWKVHLLWELMMDGSKRFGELQRCGVKISPKVLTQQLKELEQDKLIIRQSYDEMPPRVEYSITEFGKTLYPLMIQMHEWTVEYIKRNGVDANDFIRKTNEKIEKFEAM